MHSSLMIIFFRVANTVLLAALGWYFFKKYFKSQTEEKITQQQALVKGLEEQGYFLEGKVHKLNRTLGQQEKNEQELHQKIDEWVSCTAAQQAAAAHQRELFATQALQRALIKNEMMNRRLWKAHVVPEALILLQKELQAKFAHAATAAEFTDTIVHRLEREQ